MASRAPPIVLRPCRGRTPSLAPARQWLRVEEVVQLGLGLDLQLVLDLDLPFDLNLGRVDIHPERALEDHDRSTELGHFDGLDAAGIAQALDVDVSLTGSVGEEEGVGGL